MGDEVKYEIGDRILATKDGTLIQGTLEFRDGSLYVPNAEWSLADLLEYGWDVTIVQRARRFSIADIMALRDSFGIDASSNAQFADFIKRLEQSNGRG